MRNRRVIWGADVFVGYGKNCHERLILIFKGTRDKRLKWSVTLGFCAMKYIFDLAKCL